MWGRAGGWGASTEHCREKPGICGLPSPGREEPGSWFKTLWNYISSRCRALRGYPAFIISVQGGAQGVVRGISALRNTEGEALGIAPRPQLPNGGVFEED